MRASNATVVRLGVLLLAGLCGLGPVRPVQAETYPPIPPSLTTPDQVETSIGTLNFRDGIPDQATADKLYDQLDLQRGVSAYLNGLRGVSILAARNGIRAAGVKDNEGVLIFSELMDAQSLFLTANADTIYFIGDSTSARADGGRGAARRARHVQRHVVPLDHRLRRARPRPRPGRQVSDRCRLATTGRCPKAASSSADRPRPRALPGRAFLENNDPKPAVATDQGDAEIYPVLAGGIRHQHRDGPEGKVRLEVDPPVPPTKFVEGDWHVINTIPPNDFAYFEMLDERADGAGRRATSPELLGQLAAIGIVKGKPFTPDARMKKILTDAAAVGNAAGAHVRIGAARSEASGYYGPTSNWLNMLWAGRLRLRDAAAPITKEGVQTVAADRRAHARFAHGLLLRLHPDSPA